MASRRLARSARLPFRLSTVLFGALASAGLASLASACGANRTAALQTPAVVSGTVTARPACPPSPPAHACSFLVALVPGAVVQATGKDGTHVVRADSHGHYQLSLLGGVWNLSARRPPTGPPGSIEGAGSGRQVVLKAGESRRVDLTASG